MKEKVHSRPPFEEVELMQFLLRSLSPSPQVKLRSLQFPKSFQPLSTSPEQIETMNVK